MNDIKTSHLSFTEVCLKTGVAEETVIEIIEQGIVEPVGASPDDWHFSPYMVTVAKKAVRLHRDLEVNWAGIALAIDLLEQLEEIREHNRCLQRRLNKFVDQ
jgi:chaperone modulatory protein CbpM